MCNHSNLYQQWTNLENILGLAKWINLNGSIGMKLDQHLSLRVIVCYIVVVVNTALHCGIHAGVVSGTCIL